MVLIFFYLCNRMEIDKLTIKNFKCFDEEGASIETLKFINVIIGKNNSGKSSIIEVFKFLTTSDKDFFNNKRNGKTPELELEHIISEYSIKQLFKDHHEKHILDSLLSLTNFVLQYNINEKVKYVYKGVNPHASDIINRYNNNNDEKAKLYFNKNAVQMNFPLKGKQFSHLSAERDIQLEASNHTSPLTLSTNGQGATNLLQNIINRSAYDSDLVEKTLLSKLNEILSPDIDFTRILVQLDEFNVRWEIYFESDDGRIPLSKMGSGVKTVLLVLILLYVKPEIEGKTASDYVFAFEELENNLHPSLQRRLYNFIYKFAMEHKCVFFLTTHSNIVIDLYNSLEETQILHISKVKDKTSIKSTSKVQEFKTILNDLEVRASDILQSNGVIWVEGPSDRTYINHWLKTLDNTLVEGYHYSIMFYGGRLLSHLSFDDESSNNNLIELLKLSQNAFAVIDRDGETSDAKLNETKTRIQKELGENNTWITKGREIENYLSNETLKKWLQNDHSIDCIFNNEPNEKLENNISRIRGAKKIKYHLSKNKYAHEIVKYIDKNDINMLDLTQKLELLIATIREWNKM